MKFPIGARLRAIREGQGLTQGHLPFPHTTVSRMENGKVCPSIGMLERWCEVLGVPLAEVLDTSNAWEEKELLRDAFIKEACDDLLNLTLVQRGQVLEVLRSLQDKPKAA